MVFHQSLGENIPRKGLDAQQLLFVSKWLTPALRGSAISTQTIEWDLFFKGREQVIQRLSQGWMGKDAITQNGVGQLAHHGYL